MRSSIIAFLLIFLALFMTSSTSLAEWSSVVLNDPLEATSIETAIYKDPLYGELMAVSCIDKDYMETVIHIGEFLEQATYKVEVRTRFDEEQVENSSWMATNNQQGVSGPIGGKSRKDFVRNLSQKSSLYLRVFDYKGVAYDRKISLIGASDVIFPLMKACSVSKSQPVLEGVDEITIQEIDSYGPNFTACIKKSLQNEGLYSGAIDGEKDNTFIKSVDEVLDNWVADCRRTKPKEVVDILCKKTSAAGHTIIPSARDQEIESVSCSNISIRQ